MTTEFNRDALEGALAGNIRAERARQQLGQVELAHLMRSLGFSAWRASTVSEIEHRQRKVTVVEMFALANALDTTPAQLLQGTDAI